MSQYYNYKTGILILLMSVTAFIIMVVGFYYNDSLMGHTPQAIRYIILGIFESLLLLPLLLYILGNNKSVKHAFRIRPISLKALRDILFITIGSFLVLQCVQHVIDLMAGGEVAVNADMKIAYPLNYILAILLVGVVTPVVEESIFRGYMLRVMLRSKVSPVLAIVIQAALFAVVHINYQTAPTVFLAGIILGFMAYSFYSIIPGIILHSIFNILVLIDINVPSVRESIVYGHPLIAWAIFAAGTILLTIGLVSIRKNVHVHRRRKEGVGDEK